MMSSALPRVLLLGAALALMAGPTPVSTAAALPAVRFTESDGRARTLAELVAESSATRSLVLRVQAGWCGTCQWQAAWTPELLRATSGTARVVDLLVADEDNGPADGAALKRWAQRLPPSVRTLTGAPDRLRPLLSGHAPLPWVIVIDTRTAAVRATLANPSPDAVLAALDVPRATPKYDDRFSADRWALIQAMRLPDAPPSDPSNRVADSAAAATLGRALFFETRLSPADRACSSCHSPDLLFTNGKDVASEGVGPGSRNVPTILLTSHARWLLWDGRADGLWSQAAIPFEDPTEMGSSRLFVAHAVRTHHREAYEAVFGALPPLDDAARFPARGAPGTVEWARMTDGDRTAVSTILANVGKAIAAFERQLDVAPNALDRYASGDRNALSATEKDGLVAFMQAGCAQCHYGPRLSDEAFHNLRFPTGRSDRAADRGRADGLTLLAQLEFSAAGAFSDGARAPRRRGAGDAALGAFRTPGLRGVPLTMPYGHGGGFGGLRSVIDAHRTGGLASDSPYAIGVAEPWAQGFDPALVPSIQTFLQTLKAELRTPMPRRSSRPR